MEKRLKILIANDDGIQSEGIARLARMASQFGDVWVVAPSSQCSGMSQKLTIFNNIIIEEIKDFPVPVMGAYAVGGTPADCVKLGVSYLMPEKPDYVFSGINCGYNAGYDIAYSGTIGAAMEAVMNGVPAIAYSAQHDGTFDVVEKYMPELTRELIERGQERGEVWNINFPGCPLDELKGIKRDCAIADVDLYENDYSEEPLEDGKRNILVSAHIISPESAPEGSDARAVLENYISVGKIKCMVL